MTELNVPTTDDFAAMLEESFGPEGKFDGKVVTGTIIAVDKESATIDIGLKAEGRIPLKEFSAHGQSAELSVGDQVEVFVERIENAKGEAMLSREKARREEAWTVLEKSYEAEERVNGVIFGRVKGGFTVDLSGAVAFLPGSQVDVRPIRDVTPLMNIEQPFQILKMDRKRGNIVVSRRAILEETRAEQRSEIIENLAEGKTVEGVVKNITDYGAFVDLGGIDGLLHVTDISWKRINHPSDILNIGDSIDVQIIRLNPDTQRISLGMKQLTEDPWETITKKYPIGSKLTGRITNITDYGAFVELDDGVEGLVHVSEMSWVKKNVHPGKIVSSSQEVEVMVLEIDQKNVVFHLVLNSAWIIHGLHLLINTLLTLKSKVKLKISLSLVFLLALKMKWTAWFIYLILIGINQAKKRLQNTKKVTLLKQLSLMLIQTKNVSHLVLSNFLVIQLKAFPVLRRVEQ